MQTKQRPISQQQINEWVESPVTEFVKYGLETYTEEMYASLIDAFAPFLPQRTQEMQASILGAIDTLEDMIDIFGGDWSLLESEDDDSNEIESEVSE